MSSTRNPALAFGQRLEGRLLELGGGAAVDRSLGSDHRHLADLFGADFHGCQAR
jgi:hypothetical protein